MFYQKKNLVQETAKYLHNLSINFETIKISSICKIVGASTKIETRFALNNTHFKYDGNCAPSESNEAEISVI